MAQNVEPQFEITPHQTKPSGGLSGGSSAGQGAPSPGGVQPATGEPSFEIGPDVKFERGPLSAGDVAMGAATSFVPSAIEFGKSLVHPVLHPIETGQALGALGKGLYSKAAGALGAEQDQAEKARVEAPVEAVKQHFIDRYGSVENAKRTFATDPVGFLADVSIPFTGGGGLIARAPGVVGKVGQVAQKVGSVIDPLSVTAKTAAAVPQATAFLTSWKSGTSYRGMSDAAKAGAELNPEFLKYANGMGRPEDVVDAVSSAIAQKQRNASAEYIRGMDEVRAAQPLDYTNVINAIADQRSRAYSAGNIQTRSTAAEALARAENKVAEFYFQNPHPTAHTITDFNDLKIALDDIAREYKGDRVAQGAVTNVRKAVYDTIENFDPRYAKIMEKYGAEANEIKEITKDLAGGNRDTVAARLRKMMKGRDSAEKKRLLDSLAEIDPNIPYMLAGIEAQSVFPQGVRGALTSVGLGLGANPILGGAMAPLLSPRVSGTLQYGLGAVSGVPGQIEKRIPAPLRAGAYGSGEAAQILNQDREQHRAGGRVGAGIAESLMRAADKAKRELGKQTETLLDAPDEHIAKALDIAKRHI